MTSININNLWVEDSQAGEQAILFIHGLGGTSNFWNPLLSALEDYRLIRPDLAGAGRSSDCAEKLSIESHVSSLVELLDTLNVEKAHVIAHSMGTIIAQHLAISYPTRVLSLALFGPIISPAESAREGSRNRAAQARKGKGAMQEIADAICQSATSNETKAERLVSTTLIRESIMRQPTEGYALNCEALAEAQPANIDKLAMPVLLVTGDEDRIGTPETLVKMAEQLSNQKNYLLKGCGHWTVYEKPFECIRLLKDFYNELGN